MAPVYRAMAQRFVPDAGLTWLHFDAHPDLLLPPALTAAQVYDLATLLARIDIGSFLLPGR